MIMDRTVFDTAETFDYYGFTGRRFLLDDRTATVVLPASEPVGWCWRTEFFGAFDIVDAEMVRRGFALVHYDLHDQFGCPTAVTSMEDFHEYLTTVLGFAAKAILFGFSRGGLYAVNFAAAHPEKTAALYLDAPVLDLKSWPFGKKGDPHQQELCLDAYGLTREELATYRGNPIDKAERLLAERIPLLLIAGGADETVPYVDNGARLTAHYRGAGMTLLEIVKPGCGHHPHGPEDPTEACDFLCAHYTKE